MKNKNKVLKLALILFCVFSVVSATAFVANACSSDEMTNSVERALPPIEFGGNSISEDISGLAFKFDVEVEGMRALNSKAIYDNATVNGNKLITMGAIVTNGVSTIDIEAKNLCYCDATTASFAVRIINIPEDKYDVNITATPYIVVEIDDAPVVLSAEEQTRSCNDILYPDGKNDIIPEGGIYTTIDGAVWVAGDEFPTPQAGDVYQYGNYEYCYQHEATSEISFEVEDVPAPRISKVCWEQECTTEHWGVRCVANIAEPGAMLETINHRPITSLTCTFANLHNFTTAPPIPSTVTNMTATYACSGLQYFGHTIPASVKNMESTFGMATKLSGTINIDANPEIYDDCFFEVHFNLRGITLTGNSMMLDEIGLTGNEYCEECNGQNIYPESGDTFETKDYIYTYEAYAQGWSVKVKDETQSTYEDIMDYIQHTEVVNITGTFANCTNLTVAPKIPDTVTSVSWAFVGCTSLTETPVLSDNILHMNRTFEGCTSLTTVSNFPLNAHSLSETFVGCISLRDVPDIPDKVQYMDNTFEGCISLIEAPVLSSRLRRMNCAFKGSGVVETPEFPDTLVWMVSAFEDCASLTKVAYLPNSVCDLTNCFKGCTSLQTIPNFPTDSSSYIDIGGMFENCTSLTSVPSIPYMVWHLDRAFYNCTSLTGTIEINSGLDSEILYYYRDIENCFKNVDFQQQNLTLCGTFKLLDLIGATGKNYCTECNGICKELKEGDTYETEDYIYVYKRFDAAQGWEVTVKDKTKTTYEIIEEQPLGADVLSLNNAFKDCINLTDAPLIPSAVIQMENAFYNCTALVSRPDIPDTVSTAEAEIFSGCAQFGFVHDLDTIYDYGSFENAMSDINNGCIGSNSDGINTVRVCVKPYGDVIIILNGDVTVKATTVVSTDLILNLNGHSITTADYSSTVVSMFQTEAKAGIKFVIVGNGGSLNVIGEGTARTAAIVHSSNNTLFLQGVHLTSNTQRGLSYCLYINSNSAVPVSKNVIVRDCNIEAYSTSGRAMAVEIRDNNNVYFDNCVVIAYANYNEDTYGTIGINARYSKVEAINCDVSASNVGVQSYFSDFFIDGGRYRGFGHGGMYLCGDANCVNIVRNASIEWMEMPEGYVATLPGNSTGFYIGGEGSANSVFYIYNCTIAGKSRALAIRNTSGETNNTIYMSGCTITTGNVRLDGGHILYIGADCNFDASDCIMEASSQVIQTDEIYIGKKE